MTGEDRRRGGGQEDRRRGGGINHQFVWAGIKSPRHERLRPGEPPREHHQPVGDKLQLLYLSFSGFTLSDAHRPVLELSGSF